MLNPRVRKLCSPISLFLCLCILLTSLPGSTYRPRRRYTPSVAERAQPVQPIPDSQGDDASLPVPAPPLAPDQPPVAKPAPWSGSGAGVVMPVGLEAKLPPRPPGLASYPHQSPHSAPRVVMHQAGGAEVIMQAGWNLISLPEEPFDTDPAVVLASIEGSYARVYTYDACDFVDPWKLYDPGDPAASDLTAVDHTMGLWVEMTEGATLMVSGTRPEQTVVRLCRGWNVIGYPQVMALPVEGALASISGRYDRVFGWDEMDMSDPWAFYDVGAPGWANDVQVLKPGRGYWVHATQESTLVITPPVIPPEMEVPGCIASPGIRSRVSGQVPITLTTETQLRQVMVDYWPVNDLEAVEVLATALEAEGGSRVATLDTTVLANGSYTIRVSGVDDSGELVACGTMVTVEGEYKPGRVRFTVTDLTVPVAGLPIVVGRTYDSLERNQVGDFGHGWSLAIGNPKLEVDPDHNVTLTMPNGRRVTYYYHPRTVMFLSIPHYIPEAGVYGSLRPKACGLVVASGGQWFCFPGGPYQESVSGYVYTDPYGREFDMGTDGKLRSIKDLNDNVLTFTPDGIVSSVGGMAVEFTRDAENRITMVTDPMGNEYEYEYDAAGDMVDVHLPGIETPITYHYNPDHYFLGAVDPRGNTIIEDTYYPDGRLKSETDALGNTFQYTYDLDTRATVMTDPDGGIVTTVRDRYGNVVSRTDPLDQTTTYTYDANHNLLSHTDALSRTTSYTYDDKGNQTSVTDPLSNTRYTTYNCYSSPTSEVDALGNVRTVSYDARYMPVNIGDDLGPLGGYTWDSHGSPLTYSNGNGEETRYTYDQYGNLTGVTDPLDHTTIYTYDLLGRKLSHTDALSSTTRYEYDPLGHVTTITNALELVTRYEYDMNGNRTAVVDTGGRRTEYVYDAANRLERVDYPDGASENYTYDWRGNILTHEVRAGHVTRYRYDLAGQTVGVTYADGTPDAGMVSYAYDAAGRTVAVTDPLGHTTVYTYDDASRPVQVTDPLSRTTTYGYDANGRRTAEIDPLGHRIEFAYDVRGRLTVTTYPDGTTVRWGYDGASRLVSRTDQAGKVTTHGYDDAGQLVSVTNPMSQTTGYEYDAVGNLRFITDANFHRTGFEYDALGRRVRKVWPDDSFEAFVYDDAGNMVDHRLADGHVNAFDYDDMDRLTRSDYFDGQVVTFGYTAGGLRETVTDGRGVTTYAYDSRNRVTQITQPDGRTVAYTYDAAGNRLSMTTPVGVITYGYDATNQLTSVTDPEGRAFAYTYNDGGLRTQLSYPNGVIADYSYDQLDRLTGIVQRKGGATLASYTYALGTAGNRLGVTEVDGSSIEWVYDDAYRLLEETCFDSSGGVITQTAYTYDPVGNRLSRVINGQTTTYTYNELDQLTSVGAAQYSYDGRGNLVQVSDGADVTAYVWDAADRLTGVALPDGTDITYDYGADGQRVRQTIGTRVTNYLWDEASLYGDVVLETDESGTPLASYVLGSVELLSQERDDTTGYYLHDGQGSVRTLADADGNITDRYSYTAFGGLLEHQGATTNSYLYMGQQFDELTRLYSLRARYYAPLDGRFLSRDTVEVVFSDPVELNRYVYVANDSVNAVDPSGLQILMEYSQQEEESSVETATVADELGYTEGEALEGITEDMVRAGEGILETPPPGGTSEARAAYEAARSVNYRGTYFANNPALRAHHGEIVVHHNVPLETLVRRPGIFTPEELNAASNLRGIPLEMNSNLHLSQIHGAWRTFWQMNPAATRADILAFAQSLEVEHGLLELAYLWFLG
jgi:RHS repeat-associated protein